MRVQHQRNAVPLVMVVLVCSTPTYLLAQTTREPTNITLDRWQPGLDLESILGVNIGTRQILYSYEAWLKAGVAADLIQVIDNSRDITGALVGHRIYTHLGGTMTLLPWLQVGANLPLVLYQGRGGEVTPALGALEGLTAGGLGDLSLFGKAHLSSAEETWVDLAVLAALSVPSHVPRDSYLGQSNLTFTATGVASKQLFEELWVAGNLGFHWRPTVEFLDAEIGPEIRLSVGASYSLEPLLDLPFEAAAAWHMAVRADAPFRRINESPNELMFEATYFEWMPIAVNAGVGIGVTGGIGTPSVRVFIGSRWVQRPGDRDGDGVPDSYDGCPDEKEDPDGFEDEDGCPDPDNDQDGILDVVDGCPNEAESFNDFEDEDGCPEDLEAILEGGRISLSEAVHFESGKAILKPRSKRLLNNVAILLKKNPQIGKIRIEGHTDSEGGDEDNMVLSQDRAHAVRRYLISKEVDEKRLTAKGYGESKSVATNKTARGR
ncbi:OmpA family protein, partial [Myxococcota bacterium]